MSRPLSWILPAASTFAFLAVTVLVGVAVGPGCQTRCFSNFDCGGEGSYCSALGRCETECFTDEDCRKPPECQNNPSACLPKGLWCNGIGKCKGRITISRTGTKRPTPIDDPVLNIEGWDDAPASGKAFIVNNIAIAGQDRGFDIDGACDSTGCIDNVLWRLGELGNDQIRQGLLGGESLLLMEVAGLDNPYQGEDRSVAVKIYGARDADDPFFPANNFEPNGQGPCCQFKINDTSLMQTPSLQAKARAPAKIERGRVRSLAPVDISFHLTVGVPPHPEIRIDQVLISGRLPASLQDFADGLLGGAVPVQTLAQTENPYCKTISPRCPVTVNNTTLIDLVSTLMGPKPDIDLDFDGNECILDTDGDGNVDLCCDGEGPIDSCNPTVRTCTRPIAPPFPDTPSSCAKTDRVADGYSVAITFTAVAATIVGVGQ